MLNKSLLALAAGALALSACQHGNDSYRGDFYANLASEYAGFAESEGELGHTKTHDYFARKSESASANADVLPETPDTWKLEGEKAVELNDARARLMKVRGFNEHVASQDVARTQLLYDCWIVQAADAKSADPFCRQEFLDELQGLEKAQASIATDKARPTSYTILFPVGSAELNSDADYAINQTLAAVADLTVYTITLTGHTDRAGDAEKNLALSKERVEAVRTALVAKDISDDAIETEAVGEGNPQVPTLDGTERSRNRRVEINIEIPFATGEAAE